MSDGTTEEAPGRHSVLREYKVKLENIYDRFLTKKGVEMARRRQAAAVSIYENLLKEAQILNQTGRAALQKHFHPEESAAV